MQKWMTKKSKMTSTAAVTKRLQTKMVTEETHSCKEKLEARQLFSLVHRLDFVELFASIIVSFVEYGKISGNSVTSSREKMYVGLKDLKTYRSL